MAIQNSLERAEMLFEMGEYVRTCEMALALTKQDERDNYKAWLLAAKSYIYCAEVPDTEARNTFLKLTKEAYACASNVEEEIQIEYELQSAVSDWAPKAMSAAANVIIQQPTNKEKRNYLRAAFNPASYELLSTGCMAFLIVGNSSFSYNLSDNERAELRTKVCGESRSPEVDEIALFELALETAKQLFANMRTKLENNNAGSPEFMKQVATCILQEWDTTVMILQAIHPDRHLNFEENHSTTALRIYLTEKDVIRFLLDAKVYPAGRAFSVMGDPETRENLVKQWHWTNTLIKGLSPNYEPGNPPSANRIDGSNNNSGGCYVATAVYGSYDCPQVWTLRRFRDNTLASTWYGRAFIRTYYATSPTLVKWFGHTAWFKNMWRGKLDKMVETLQKQGVESTPYQDRNW